MMLSFNIQIEVGKDGLKWVPYIKERLHSMFDSFSKIVVTLEGTSEWAEEVEYQTYEQGLLDL